MTAQGLVAVTGGLGFIGSAVMRELGARGYRTFPIDRAAGGDLLRDDLPELLGDCCAVIHLAGVLGTAELFQSVDEAIDTNIKGTVRVLEACQAKGFAYVGITLPEHWDNVYSATKKCATQLASAWHRHCGVRVSHVRAFNVFGPGQKATGVQKIIPTFAECAWRGQPLPIWGDGTQRVDLVHVDDVARMMADALRFGANELFDAATGQLFTVNEVARMVLEITGSRSPLEYLPMRKGEHPVGEVENTGAGWDLLPWRPRFDLERLRGTVESYRPTGR